MPPPLLPSHPDPLYDAHLAPTLADVPLNPRRRLRDGRASSGSSRRGSASSRGARGTKRSRSTTAEVEQDHASLPDQAEASRRLPPLRPRPPRAHVSSDNDPAQLSSDDEPLSRRQAGTSPSLPQFVPSSPPDVDHGAPSGAGPSTSTGEPWAAGSSTPRWTHIHTNRPGSSELSEPDPVESSTFPDTLPNRAGGSGINEPCVFRLPRRGSPRLTSAALDDGDRDAAMDEHDGVVLPARPPHGDEVDELVDELEDETNERESQPNLDAAPQQAESASPSNPPADSSFESAPNGSNRSPSPAESTDSESSGRRFTAQEKGKGRAVPRPSVIDVSDDDMFDQSVQFIESRPAPPIEINDDDEVMGEEEPPEAAIDEESSLAAFTCPVCFMAPTAPALTPCGHVMCYGCLHQALLAAIGRQLVPFPHPQVHRRRKKSNFADLAAGRQYIPPAKWAKDTLEEAWAASQDDYTRRQLAADNQPQAQIEAIVEAQRQGRGSVQVQHELAGLWKLSDTQWVIEGECPVCRKQIPGGLGPLNYRLGSVVLLETRVARAGETEILSLSS